MPAGCLGPTLQQGDQGGPPATDSHAVRSAPQDTVLPKFDLVKAEHVVPAMRALLKQLHADIDTLEGSVQPTWAGLVAPLERIADRQQRTWGVVGHLKVSWPAAGPPCPSPFPPPPPCGMQCTHVL